MATGVLGCLLLSMFLVSGKLVEIAERQPLGDSRDRWLDVAEGVDRVSNFMALNRPYDLIADIRGVGTDAGEKVDTIEEVAASLGLERDPTSLQNPLPTIDPQSLLTATVPPSPSPQTPTASNTPQQTETPEGAASTPVPDVAGEEEPSETVVGPEATAVPGEADSTSLSQPTPVAADQAELPPWLVPPEDPALPPPSAIRTVTSENPLRVYVAGDSQAFYPGHALTSVLDGGLLDVAIDVRNSTGLARPDFFNWPAELLDVVTQDDPELVVLFLGGNDWQTMENSEGVLLRRGSDAWRSEWAWRMQIAFDVLTAPHRHIVWVGLPPARAEPFDTGYPEINDASWPVTLTRFDVTMVDIWDLFGGDGPYQESVSPPTGGDPVRVRQEDGIHVNRRGARWVAELIVVVAAEHWEFEESG